MAHDGTRKPREVTCPPIWAHRLLVDGWRTRALIVGAVFAVSLHSAHFWTTRIDHLLRAWVLGMTCSRFGWSRRRTRSSDGAVLSGGKWGLLLRRPLEAMTRTLPLVFAYLVVVIFMKRLYLWAQSPTRTKPPRLSSLA